MLSFFLFVINYYLIQFKSLRTTKSAKHFSSVMDFKVYNYTAGPIKILGLTFRLYKSIIYILL